MALRLGFNHGLKGLMSQMATDLMLFNRKGFIVSPKCIHFHFVVAKKNLC